ncbi:MAG: hypothetical protein GY950_37050 [bacterium]|nr:hypothetical protein [bacterium]
MRKFKCYVLCVSLCLLAVSIWGGQVVPIPGLINPDEIKIDEKQIYFIDGTSIHIYSLADFKFKKKFGKKGEGPQEFLRHPQLALAVGVSTPNITVTGMSRVSYFTKDGNFIKAVKTSYQHGRFIPFGDGFVGWGTVQEENTAYGTLNIYNADFKVSGELTRWERQPPRGEIHLLNDPRMFRVSGGRVFAALDKDFIIHVFNRDGKKPYTIEKEYEKLKVTDAHKEAIMDYFRKDPRFRALFERFKKRLRFPEYFPVIRDLGLDNETLVVRTYKKSGGNTEFFLLDLEGKLLKTVFLPIEEKDGKESYPYVVKNGKVYQLVENDGEEWDLHVR